MNWLRRNATRVPIEEDLRTPFSESPVSRGEGELQAQRDKTQVPQNRAELPESIFEEDSNEGARSDDPPKLFPPYDFTNISTTPPSRGHKRKAEDDILASDDSTVIVYNSSGVCPDIAVSQPCLPALHILIIIVDQAQSASHQASTKGTPTPPSSSGSKPHLRLRPDLGRSISSPA